MSIRRIMGLLACLKRKAAAVILTDNTECDIDGGDSSVIRPRKISDKKCTMELSEKLLSEKMDGDVGSFPSSICSTSDSVQGLSYLSSSSSSSFSDAKPFDEAGQKIIECKIFVYLPGAHPNQPGPQLPLLGGKNPGKKLRKYRELSWDSPLEKSPTMEQLLEIPDWLSTERKLDKFTSILESKSKRYRS